MTVVSDVSTIRAEVIIRVDDIPGFKHLLYLNQKTRTGILLSVKHSVICIIS